MSKTKSIFKKIENIKLGEIIQYGYPDSKCKFILF